MTHVLKNTSSRSLTVVSNMAAGEDNLGRKPGCIFCKIAAKEVEETELKYENDQIAAFSDRKPAAEHHYLVVPKEHYGNPKSLYSEDHIGLLERLLEVGKKIIADNQADGEDVLFGYHWPPFNSIQHLHLHVISPRSQMGFFARQIYKPNSLWFVTHDWLLEYLKKKLPNSSL